MAIQSEGDMLRNSITAVCTEYTVQTVGKQAE